jgi:hypothetical protein
MGYSNFKKIKTVVRQFNLDLKVENEMFAKASLIMPSAWLIETLAKSKITMLTNEKTKSERIISPILLEVAEKFNPTVSFFSGESIDVNSDENLSGPCDFFFSLQPPKPYIEAPIISLAEAKDEDMDWGIAQCAAQMYGATLFNKMEGKDIPFIYGCATDGIEWQFLKLENSVYTLDNKIYTDLKEILGVWHYIIELFLV